MNRMITLSAVAAALTAATAQGGAIPSADFDWQSAPHLASADSDASTLYFHSETQFERDYGAAADKIAPGVYFMTDGPFVGKAVSMGISGLNFDLSALERQAKKPMSDADRKDLNARIAKLRDLKREYQSRDVPGEIAAKAQGGQGVTCWHYDFVHNRYQFYTGFAEASVTGGLYLDNGGGGYNYYYARLSAVTNIYVFPPYNVHWGDYWLSASARATNALTGQTVNATPYAGLASMGASTGWVYSGPTFGHNLSGTATAIASGDCFAYLSISDQFVL